MSRRTRGGSKTPMRDRLLAKRRIDDSTGCWLWTGTTTSAGYGQIREPGCKLYVHREAARVFLGAAIEGRVVCHHCDTPRCFNPEHLFVGEHADNVADKCAKGRQTRGEKNGIARLTEADVLRIRRLVARGPRGTARDVAAEYGLGGGHVSLIVNGKLWKHLPMHGHLLADADQAERDLLDTYDGGDA